MTADFNGDSWTTNDTSVCNYFDTGNNYVATDDKELKE